MNIEVSTQHSEATGCFFRVIILLNFEKSVADEHRVEFVEGKAAVVDDRFAVAAVANMSAAERFTIVAELHL